MHRKRLKNMKRDERERSSPFNTDAFREFAQRTLSRTLPKILDSAYVITIAPEAGTAEIQMAVEIGLAILHEKPLIVMAQDGRVHGEKLLRIADHVVRGDLTTEEGRLAAAEKLKVIMQQ